MLFFLHASSEKFTKLILLTYFIHHQITCCWSELIYSLYIKTFGQAVIFVAHLAGLVQPMWFRFNYCPMLHHLILIHIAMQILQSFLGVSPGSIWPTLGWQGPVGERLYIPSALVTLLAGVVLWLKNGTSLEKGSLHLIQLISLKFLAKVRSSYNMQWTSGASRLFTKFPRWCAKDSQEFLSLIIPHEAMFVKLCMKYWFLHYLAPSFNFVII